MPLSPRKQARQSTSDGVIGQPLCEDIDNISMSLVAKNYCSKVMKGLQDLRKGGILCDYALYADGTRINVHKAVMAACSDYFQVMLTGNIIFSNDWKNISEVFLKIILSSL